MATLFKLIIANSEDLLILAIIPSIIANENEVAGDLHLGLFLGGLLGLLSSLLPVEQIKDFGERDGGRDLELNEW